MGLCRRTCLEIHIFVSHFCVALSVLRLFGEMNLEGSFTGDPHVFTHAHTQQVFATGVGMQGPTAVWNQPRRVLTVLLEMGNWTLGITRVG